MADKEGVFHTVDGTRNGSRHQTLLHLLIMSGPLTSPEVGARMGINPSAARSYLAHLQKQGSVEVVEKSPIGFKYGAKTPPIALEREG